MEKPLLIDYYSDILCVWAWIALPRLEELEKRWGDQIKLQHHYVDVFGDVERKIRSAWSGRDSYSGFAKHVQHSVGQFAEISVHPGLWQAVQPKTSANAHLVCKAVDLSFGAAVAQRFDLEIRKTFFLGAEDIGDMELLFLLLEKLEIEVAEIENSIQSGAAMAALMGDYKKAQSESVKGSPTYILDGGRQMLFGNVGYRVINANIEELLRKPVGEASWC